MSRDQDKTVEIFSDGACSGNPGPGGYGAILKYGEKVKEISGYELNTTNNRMEMMAVIQALRQLKRPCKVKVVTDSKYLVNGMTQWLPGWIKHNWITSQKKPVLNQHLWKELVTLSQQHHIEWHWIKGHNGNPLNERCDQLAKAAIRQSRT